MPVVVLVTLLGAVTVVVALLRDEPMTPRGATGVRPAWRGLPDPADLARVSFPSALSGYDPASVDVHFESVLRAYEDLWAVATPEIRERARMRAEARDGLVSEAAAGHADDHFTGALVPEPPAMGETDADALAAETSLAALERDEHDVGNDDTGPI